MGWDHPVLHETGGYRLVFSVIRFARTPLRCCAEEIAAELLRLRLLITQHQQLESEQLCCDPAVAVKSAAFR
eukprot:830595-Amphidinium_carterae.1